jgi:nicotinate-nucleotide pyrophosphorylase (carboxylating)
LIVGGVDTHRIDLSSCVMLKDNHIAACKGDIEKAIQLTRRVCSFTQKIEVECKSEEEAITALQAGADIVMLDNMKPLELKQSAERIRKIYPKSIVEASGGITEDNVKEYFSPFINVISMGCLTLGVSHVDFSLKIVEKEEN